MAQNKILITGRSGFLGGILYEGLTKRGMDVIDLQELFSSRIDIKDQFYFDKNMEVQTVVHTAGKAHFIPKSTLESNIFHETNLNGTINLCKAIDKCDYKPKAFIFISTVAVYGREIGNYLNENEALLGTTPYARSKIDAEAYLGEWAANHGIKLSILRLPLVAGRNPPGNLKAVINGIKKNRYFSIGNANAKKSMVWAEDILDVLPILEKLGGIYNLTDGQNPTIRELENGITNVLGKKKVIQIPYFIGKLLAIIGDLLGNKFILNSSKFRKLTSNLTFDDQKARELLNWRPSKILDKVGDML